MLLTGIDLVENSRIARMIERSFETIKEIFTEREIEYCMGKNFPEQSFGVRFAAKEAVIKAIQSNILAYDLRNIEVENIESGAPELIIHSEKIKNRIAEKLGRKDYGISITLSHEKEFSLAFVVIN